MKLMACCDCLLLRCETDLGSVGPYKRHRQRMQSNVTDTDSKWAGAFST